MNTGVCMVCAHVIGEDRGNIRYALGNRNVLYFSPLENQGQNPVSMTGRRNGWDLVDMRTAQEDNRGMGLTGHD